MNVLFSPHNQNSPIDLKHHGSLTLEAAIVFPVFFIVWIPFLYLLRYCLLYETASATVHEAASVFSSAGYLFERAGFKELNEDYHEEEQDVLTEESWSLLIDQLGGEIAATIGDSFMDDNAFPGVVTSSIHWQYSHFFYEDPPYDNLIDLVLYVPIQWPDPFGFFNNRNIVVHAWTRAFIGLDRTSLSTETSEEEKEVETYYRIGNGKKYHSLDCYLIQKTTDQISSSDAIAQGYTACEICHPEEGLVWISSGGEKYHTYDCRILFPTLTPLSTAELQSGLYTPCALCQSDNPWFEHRHSSSSSYDSAGQ